MDPDPGGPKTCGGSGSPTLVIAVDITWPVGLEVEPEEGFPALCGPGGWPQPRRVHQHQAINRIILHKCKEFHLKKPQNKDWYRGPIELVQHFAYRRRSRRCKSAARQIKNMVRLNPLPLIKSYTWIENSLVLYHTVLICLPSHKLISCHCFYTKSIIILVDNLCFFSWYWGPPLATGRTAPSSRYHH